MLSYLPLLGLAAIAQAAVISPRQAPSFPSTGVIGFLYPASRGVDTETDNTAPCGGFELGGRTEFPLTGGQLSFNATRDGGNFTVRYATTATANQESEFEPLLPVIDRHYTGTSCLSTPDFTSLGLAPGDNVSFGITFIASQAQSSFYQCADVTLVESANYQAPEYECTNFTRSTQTRGGANTAAPEVEEAAASQTPESSATAPALGAAVGLAAFLVASLV